MEQITDFVSANPQYGYLIVAGLFLIVLIGLLLDWDWVVEPGGGYFNIAYFIEMFGRKTVRLVMGSVMLICIILLLHSYFTYVPSNS